MSNVVPVFPNAFFTWMDRVDQVNIDFANDINSVASDLISVETTLGTNPQNETSPPLGGSAPVKYTTVSSRISDAMNNAQLPVCALSGVSQLISNTSAGVLNNYTILYDPYKMYNNQDITIPAPGWYLITAHQTWDWWSDGFSHMYLTLNGLSNILEEGFVNWAFGGNIIDFTSNSQQVPRWQEFGKRPRLSKITWQGGFNKNDRISVYSENGTSNSAQKISNMTLRASMIRSLSAPVNFH